MSRSNMFFLVSGLNPEMISVAHSCCSLASHAQAIDSLLLTASSVLLPPLLCDYRRLKPLAHQHVQRKVRGLQFRVALRSCSPDTSRRRFQSVWFCSYPCVNTTASLGFWEVFCCLKNKRATAATVNGPHRLHGEGPE